jgi:hypothetical protein
MRDAHQLEVSNYFNELLLVQKQTLDNMQSQIEEQNKLLYEIREEAKKPRKSVFS